MAKNWLLLLFLSALAVRDPEEDGSYEEFLADFNKNSLYLTGTSHDSMMDRSHGWVVYYHPKDSPDAAQVFRTLARTHREAAKKWDYYQTYNGHLECSKFPQICHQTHSRLIGDVQIVFWDFRIGNRSFPGESLRHFITSHILREANPIKDASLMGDLEGGLIAKERTQVVIRFDLDRSENSALRALPKAFRAADFHHCKSAQLCAKLFESSRRSNILFLRGSRREFHKIALPKFSIAQLIGRLATFDRPLETRISAALEARLKAFDQGFVMMGVHGRSAEYREPSLKEFLSLVLKFRHLYEPIFLDYEENASSPSEKNRLDRILELLGLSEHQLPFLVVLEPAKRGRGYKIFHLSSSHFQHYETNHFKSFLARIASGTEGHRLRSREKGEDAYQGFFQISAYEFSRALDRRNKRFLTLVHFDYQGVEPLLPVLKAAKEKYTDFEFLLFNEEFNDFPYDLTEIPALVFCVSFDDGEKKCLQVKEPTLQGVEGLVEENSLGNELELINFDEL